VLSLGQPRKTATWQAQAPQLNIQVVELELLLVLVGHPPPHIVSGGYVVATHLPSKTMVYYAWLEVAEYLPRSTLREMFSVNWAFFNLVMDQHYREVPYIRFKCLNQDMLGTLDQLK
jgi:hypothetical protein